MDVLILIITFVANFFLGLVVFLRDMRSGMARSFIVLITSINFWIISNFMTNHLIANDIVINNIANKLAFIGGYCVLASGLAFTFFFPQVRKVNKRYFTFLVIISLAALAFSSTDAVTGRVFLTSQGDLAFTTGSLLWLYIVVAITLVVFTVRNLLAVGRIRDRHKVAQARYIMFAFSITAVVALLANTVLPLLGFGWSTTRIGPLSTVILVGTIAYTIIKHRLFDIKWAAVRTIVYAGVLLTLSGVYYVVAYILSLLVFGGHLSSTISISPINILLALILAFLFQPIKQFFDRVTNDIFYRDRYNSNDFFANLGQLLGSTTDLRGLLERASNEIGATFKAEQVFFLLYYTNTTRHHVSAGTRNHAVLPVEDARALDVFINKKRMGMIITDLVKNNVAIHHLLVSHRIGLVMPLIQEDEILGYVFLGDSRSGGYSKRDMLVLSTVRDELVIAIQNALSLHEIRELNATLQQRIDVATKELRSSNAQLKHLDEVKDEFMSMASHQLRTPLTSVKGYISMVLEGDAGNITPKQQKLLMEAFKSSERMVGLIADFLDISRLQTGKFTIDKKPFDMGDIISQEVNDLELMAKSHNIKLRIKKYHGQLPVVADESKIRQVIMNFIDNAIYYSKAKSTIVINVERVVNDVAFTVVDTGIGVPVEEQSHLFSKFFRAKNARRQRPDGTGVGLYLARRVIMAHGGSILFSSTEGKGSTFGFRLHLDASVPKHVAQPLLEVAVSPSATKK